LEQRGSSRSTRSSRLARLARQSRTCRVESSRAKWNLGLTPPPHLPEVTRVTTTLKILGVTISSSLSVNDIMCTCSPTLHALRVLRNQGMGDAALQTIYRAVVVVKLLYVCGVGRSAGSTHFPYPTSLPFHPFPSFPLTKLYCWRLRNSP